jgi:hypothetical protein
MFFIFIFYACSPLLLHLALDAFFLRLLLHLLNLNRVGLPTAHVQLMIAHAECLEKRLFA